LKHKFVHLIKVLEQLIDYRTSRQGDKLPSIGALANQYQVNKITVIRALNDLERRHLVYSVSKSGYYVDQSAAAKGT